jgi:Zn-finger nucleic acid-binding protein
MQCPRDNTELIIEHHAGIEVDHCPTCSGRWLDQDELGHLEATVASEDDRSGTIEYAKRDSEIKCPKCQVAMRAFNYRAYNLEIDTCPEGHGFWLDAGEEGKVSDVMQERVQGLARSATAEEAWGQFLGRLKKPSFWDRLTGKS